MTDHTSPAQDLDTVRRYWDADAATYDDSEGHRPRAPIHQAAWLGAMARLLPPTPARVLDVGAGTGFLSLMAARLGHEVTALDLSAGMLDRLRTRARDEGLTIEVHEGPADDPPAGPFDAVVERHVVWTLPDPDAAFAAWRRSAPNGRLVLFESVWGAAAGPADRARARALRALRRLRGTASDHHAEYVPSTRASLPLGHGPSPADLTDLVARSGWGAPRFERLVDVGWAARQGMPFPERVLGVSARFVVSAGPS